MNTSDQMPEQSTPITKIDTALEESTELTDSDLDSVAGGVTWHLPNEPVSTPWEDGADI